MDTKNPKITGTLLQGLSSAERKKFPLYAGFLAYFPDACAYVAYISWAGNNKHNPGEPLHWAREKSSDHEDCVMRHLLGKTELDGDMLEAGGLAWRAMATLQLELERRMEAGEKFPFTEKNV